MLLCMLQGLAYVKVIPSGFYSRLILPFQLLNCSILGTGSEAMQSRNPRGESEAAFGVGWGKVCAQTRRLTFGGKAEVPYVKRCFQ